MLIHRKVNSADRAVGTMPHCRPPEDKPTLAATVTQRYACSAATFGYFLLPLYAQVVLGLSLASGLLIVPVVLTVSSQLVGQMEVGSARASSAPWA